MYGLPCSSAAFHVLSKLRDYNKIGALKKELSRLYLLKFVLDESGTRQGQALIAAARIQNQDYPNHLGFNSGSII